MDEIFDQQEKLEKKDYSGIRPLDINEKHKDKTVDEIAKLVVKGFEASDKSLTSCGIKRALIIHGRTIKPQYKN